MEALGVCIYTEAMKSGTAAPQSGAQVKDQNRKDMPHPPTEPFGDAVVQGGEHTSVQTVLPPAALPTSHGACSDLCEPTLPAPINEVDSERTDILFKVYDLMLGLILCQAHICVSRLRVSAHLPQRGHSRSLCQSTRCWRDAPELCCTLKLSLFVPADACAGVGPKRPPGLLGLQDGAETTKMAAFAVTLFLYLFCCTAKKKNTIKQCQE